MFSKYFVQGFRGSPILGCRFGVQGVIIQVDFAGCVASRRIAGVFASRFSTPENIPGMWRQYAEIGDARHCGIFVNNSEHPAEGMRRGVHVWNKGVSRF